VRAPDGTPRGYEVSSQMSIEFEVDGPYQVRSERRALRATPPLLPSLLPPQSWDGVPRLTPFARFQTAHWLPGMPYGLICNPGTASLAGDDPAGVKGGRAADQEEVRRLQL
jgi:hypothetical protein